MYHQNVWIFPICSIFIHMFHCYVSLGERNSNTHFLKRIGNHFFRWSLTRPATLSMNVETKSLGFVESPRWIFGFISSWTNDPARSPPFLGGETSSPNNSEIDVGYHIYIYKVSTYIYIYNYKRSMKSSNTPGPRVCPNFQ